jgi:hypothetical protein
VASAQPGFATHLPEHCIELNCVITLQCLRLAIRTCYSLGRLVELLQRSRGGWQLAQIDLELSAYTVGHCVRNKKENMSHKQVL